MLEFAEFYRPRLRVVGLTPSLAPGGAELWLLTLCQHSQMVEYAAIVSCTHPLTLSDRFPRGTEIYVADAVNQEAIRAKVDQAIQDKNPDLIFFWGHNIDLSGLHIPVVHVSHQNASESANIGHKEYCMKLGQMPCNFMAGVSRSSVSFFPEHFQSLSRPTIIYNGSDLERVAPVFGRQAQREMWGVGKDSKVVLYIGRFYPGKGGDVAIEAMSYLPDDWHLVMYGWGREEERLRKLAFGKLPPSSTGSESRVFWPVPRLSQLGDLYAAADCVVIPSISEAFPLVMIEAWQAGVPLVISDIATLKEVEEQYNKGQPLAVVVPRPPSPEELAAGVLESQKRYCVDRAQQIATNVFTASAMAGRWESYWYECVRIWQECGLRGMTRKSPTTQSFSRGTLWTGDP